MEEIRGDEGVKSYLDDGDFQLYQGDALAVLRELPSESVHCCITSPPFFGLRDYGTGTWEGGDAECDHSTPRSRGDDIRPGDKQGTSAGSRPNTQTTCKCGARRIDEQIGLEPTPEEWVARLVEVFREVRRVLRKDGTLWVEVGDSYAANAKGSGGMSKSTLGEASGGHAISPEALQRTLESKQYEARRFDLDSSGLKPKDLIGAPWLLAFALRADGWYLRSDIVWARPNPMPESVTDRPTKSHSYVFLFSKSPRYFFDQEAVRESASANTHVRYAVARETPKGAAKSGAGEGHVGWDSATNGYVSARNIRSVWQIPTEPLPDEHYAAFPQKLVEPCIKAGTSERGCCPECGAPWVRVVERGYENPGNRTTNGQRERTSEVRGFDKRLESTSTTLGWHPTCEHCGPFIGEHKMVAPCIVLDPFLGSGTTALVARRLGRKCIGIELSERYCQMAARRTQQLSLEAAS